MIFLGGGGGVHRNFFQKDTKIVWVRYQYIQLQMLYNVNDKFVFRAKS